QKPNGVISPVPCPFRGFVCAAGKNDSLSLESSPLYFLLKKQKYLHYFMRRVSAFILAFSYYKDTVGFSFKILDAYP
ncbi:hypothetical protein, partial [uncultured Fretibacterium sp.]|uniref:hypothetical protein n=1 Tax=uncultured Fretibacterium sp. TaxID=1678694 RepID=UPI00262AB24B